MYEKGALAIYLETGLGKTAAGATGIAQLMDAGLVTRALVLAPPRVAAVTWWLELRKWAHLAHLRVIPVTGNAEERLRLLATPGPAIFCLSLNLASWLVAVAAQVRRFELVYVDESSFIKSPSAKVTRAAVSIARGARFRFVASGTPRPQGLHELWSQIYLLDGGQRLGKSYGAFLGRWFYRAGPYRLAARPGAAQEIEAKLADIVRTARSEDYIDLPPLVRNVVEVPLTAASRVLYDELEGGIVRSLADGSTKAVASASSAFNKCAQVVGGHLYDGLGSWQSVGSEKLDALEAIVAEAGEPVLIFYRFVAERERILERIPGAVHFDAKSPRELRETLEKWRAGETAALVAHVRSVGHGVDGLQSARHLVWFGLPLGSVEAMMQAEARLHRQGATGPTIVHELRTPDSIDEPIAKALFARKAGQDAFMAALADYLGTRHPEHAAELPRLLANFKPLQEDIDGTDH
jgi:SNF2 family DNA or RNA helicase